MLNTRLATLRGEIFEKNSIFFTKGAKAKKSSEIEETCFVCSKVDWGVEHMLETVFTMFRENAGFRNLYASQQYICIPHYNMLMSHVPQKRAEALYRGNGQADGKLHKAAEFRRGRVL